MENIVLPVIVDKEVDGGSIWLIKLNRPEKRNCVDFSTAEALAGAFTAFEKDEKAKVAILYGEGGNFCAGADLSAIQTSNRNTLVSVPDVPVEASGAVLDTSGPMGVTRMILSKPVIAAVSGYAVAGGLELCLWCDLRVVDSSAIFGVFCRRVGVPLIDGGTYRLPRLIGQSRALDLILTGRAVNAREALDIGLANRLIEQASLTSERPTVVEAALELAKQIAIHPQGCLRADRLSVLHGAGSDLRRGLRAEFERGEASVQLEGVDGAKKFLSGEGRHGSSMASGRAKL